MWPIKQTRFFPVALLAACGLLAACVIVYATRWGPVIYSDAAGYIMIAQNILAGRGVGLVEASGEFKLLTTQPPLFSLILAAVGWLGADLVDAVRWLHAALFGLAVVLVGGMIYRLARSLIWAAAACLFVMSAPWMVGDFCLAMSEPVFFVTALAGLFCLLLYLENSRRRYLFGAAIFTGMAFATRYMGVAFVLAGAVAVLLFERCNGLRRLGNTVLFSGIGVLPVAAWLGGAAIFEMGIRRQVQVGAPWSRFNDARLALTNLLWDWLPFGSRFPQVPYRARLVVLILLVVTLVVITLWALRRGRSTPLWGDPGAARAAGAFALYAGAFLISLAAAYVLASPTPDLNERTLSPVYPLLVMGCLASAVVWTQAWRGPRTWLWVLPVVTLVVYLAAFLPQSAAMVVRYHQEGEGYLSVAMRQSETIQAVRKLSPDTSLISNDHSAVAFLVGRPCYFIEEVVSARRQPLDARFGDDPGEPSQRVFREGGALILFDRAQYQLESMYGEKIAQRLEALTQGLTLYGDYWDGAIYFYPRGQP